MVRRGDAHLMEQESTPATSIAAGSGWYSSAARGARRTAPHAAKVNSGHDRSGGLGSVGNCRCQLLWCRHLATFCGPRLGHRAARYLNCSRRRIGGSVGRVQSDAQAAPTTSRPHRLRRAWYARLGPGERSAVLAWASFALTFGSVRALTHWIRDGHGPAGGGMSLGGKHFHHYNLGIALLTGIGAVAIRGQEQHHRHPVTALSFGTATALIADEAALLLDLEDVYWAKQGRTSVDLAVGVIAIGGLALAGAPLWPTVVRELRR